MSNVQQAARSEIHGSRFSESGPPLKQNSQALSGSSLLP